MHCTMHLSSFASHLSCFLLPPPLSTLDKASNMCNVPTCNKENWEKPSKKLENPRSMRPRPRSKEQMEKRTQPCRDVGPADLLPCTSYLTHLYTADCCVKTGVCNLHAALGREIYIPWVDRLNTSRRCGRTRDVRLYYLFTSYWCCCHL